jgi:hypothetical protein
LSWRCDQPTHPLTDYPTPSGTTSESWPLIANQEGLAPWTQDKSSDGSQPRPYVPRMGKKRIGITLLLTFLLWRSANTVFVLAVNPEINGYWQEGLTDDTATRVARALDLPPAREVHTQRYELLAAMVPPDSDLFFLHEYGGALAVYEIFSYFRISALLYPCNVQMVKVPPNAQVASATNRDFKDRYILDIRDKKSDLPESFEKIGTSPGAILWRQKRLTR